MGAPWMTEAVNVSLLSFTSYPYKNLAMTTNEVAQRLKQQK